MQRIVFTPNDHRDSAAAMLAEVEIRQEINQIVSAATSGTIGRPVPELSPWIEAEILSTRAGAGMMGPLMEEIHDRIIGNRDDDPVFVDGQQMVLIVRDQAAASVDPVLMPIPVVGTMKTTRTLIGWVIMIAAVIGLVAVLLGILARPERRDVLARPERRDVPGPEFSPMMLVFGYLIPVGRRSTTHLGAGGSRGARLGARVRIGAIGGKRRQWSTPLRSPLPRRRQPRLGLIGSASSTNSPNTSA
jgi:hypothetical protein